MGTTVVVIVALLVLLGGYYFWNNRAEKSMGTNATSTAQEQMSNSDEVNDIEADVNATGSFDSSNYNLE